MKKKKFLKDVDSKFDKNAFIFRNGINRRAILKRKIKKLVLTYGMSPNLERAKMFIKMILYEKIA